MSKAGPAWPIPLRTRAAAEVGTAVGAVSRRLGLGAGSVIGGRASLAIDPGALARLAAGHRLALVSATNGKTTTTRLLAGALAAGSSGPGAPAVGGVVSNGGGSNLPAGLVAALAGAPGHAQVGALEVDESWLGHVVGQVHPVAVALLNLSRDQLDRVSEVRRIGARWREVLASHPEVGVVANADDPIVAWAAGGARRLVRWVAAGQPWRMDATGCPACGAGIVFAGEHWGCPVCGLSRPGPDAWLDGEALVLADGRRLPFTLALPGRFNRSNAAMAAVTAGVMGIDEAVALAAMGEVTEVSGRYQVVEVGGPGTAGGAPRARLLLAKNPAGWVEMFDLLRPAPAPVVLAINARVADGRDPSWLWDVPFERLAGRVAVATGERCRDLAVRLAYAEVDHLVVGQQVPALVAARSLATHAGREPVDYVGNYTAFQDLRVAASRSQG